MVSENELETLDAFLDGELPGDEAAALQRRIDAEPALASALQSLRQERGVRAQSWRAMEPSPASIQRLMSAVEHKLDNYANWAQRLRNLKRITAAAACIVVGFLVGWMGRGTHTAPVNGPAVAVVHHQPGPVAPLTSPTAPTVTVASGTPVQVPLVDEYGHVVAVQKFDSADKAREFFDDMRHFEEKQEQMRDGNTVLVADHF